MRTVGCQCPYQRPFRGKTSRSMLALQCAALAYLLSLLPAQSLGQSTCSANTTCYQGCCNKYYNCGFGPDLCGDDVCVSTCDAKPDCGSKSLRRSRRTWVCPGSMQDADDGRICTGGPGALSFERLLFAVWVERLSTTDPVCR